MHSYTSSAIYANPYTALRLKAKNIKPGEDGRFSTARICEAIYDSDYKERLRLVREQATHKALQNAELRESLVDVEELAARMGKPLDSMKQRILCAYKLLDAEKDDLLNDLNDLWRAVFDDEAPTRPGALKAWNNHNEKQTTIKR